ncbi:MAG: DNA-binding protein [Pseudanabaena sp.]|nr:MAG: DNA-binding protein [Pseudanabaena sp.]
MKLITEEWVNKAEGDFATAQREWQVENMPNYDAVCFHSQQCIEKYLKACLQEENIAFGKTHDLTKLLDSLLIIEPSWEKFRDSLDELTAYAVEFRYPGLSDDQVIANQALADCTEIRRIVRQHLGLEN